MGRGGSLTLRLPLTPCGLRLVGRAARRHARGVEPFKDRISPGLVRAFGHQLRRHASAAAAAGFEAAVLPRLDALGLKARVGLVAEALHAALPGPAAARHATLGRMLHPGEGDAVAFEGASDERGIRGWGVWPLTEAAGRFGLDDFDGGLALLREATKRSSAEFAVRRFLLHDQGRALRTLARWVGDPHPAVRRLVSEGARPRLPWATQLPGLRADPGPALPLLGRLRDDPHPTVRLSVANFLNDVSKDHPDRAAALGAAWLRGAPPERARLVRHALRTLVKAGHPGALAALGFHPPEVEVGPLRLSAPAVRVGEALTFSARIRSTGRGPQRLVVDHVLHLLRADGSRSAKVWKGAVVELPAGGEVTHTRTHRFRETTVRTLRPGVQRVRLRVNGRDEPAVGFELRPAR